MSSSKLRNDIQGLRAVAVLSVILFHLNKNWLPGGFIGVDIFFVISGFLITTIILYQKKSDTFSLINFYTSRAQRIIPAYLALIIPLSIFAAIFFIPQDFESFTKSAKSALYFGSNIFFAKQNDYFSPAAYELPLLHTWSLAIEMQFYLLLPAILIFIPRHLLKTSLLIVTTSLLVYSQLRLQDQHQQQVYFSLLARIPEFLIGSLVALTPQEGHISKRASNAMAALGLALIILGLLTISETRSFPGLLALLPCVGTALLLKNQNSLLNRALSSSPLVLIGALSYSLYLWHWPILAIARYLSGTYTLTFIPLLAFLTLTPGCAYLSYKYIESPFRERSSAKLTAIRLSSALAISVITLAAAHTINQKLVEPLPEELTRYAIDSEICHGIIVGDCLRGDRSSSRTLLMLGDSHAAQLNYFADVVGNATHTKIRVISSSNCVTIPGFDVNRIAEWGRRACRTQIEEAQKYIPDANGIIIAGMWQFQSPSPEFMEQLESFLSIASSRGQHVLVLAQVPMLSTNPQRTYRTNSLNLHLSAAMNDEWVQANSKIKDLVSRHTNASFLDLSSSAMFATAPMLDGTPIYMDSHHLNELGSTRYGEVATPYLQAFINKLPPDSKHASSNKQNFAPL
ncbi:acyltransferase family protein [Pseudomonas gingeri]|uniref:acyltransferase family protein n=1 Tax=Pseudomonas gingeri TaxID=117681 RepID=UPI0015BF04A3|nr:acyltransferase family protein [Pseudomonas gingeri]NWD52156.1 acyltransferase [Pseudomonas gingeri]